MIPDSGEGYYWIKSYGYIDCNGNKGISDWYIAEYIEGGWEIMSSECGLNSDEVVEIGDKIKYPSMVAE